jgi:hypothetical protein
MLGEGRKADEICKEYGHYPTLACAGRCKGRTRVDDDCIQLRSAGGAKACVRRQRGAAGGAAALEWRPAAGAEASSLGVLVTANRAAHENYRITSVGIRHNRC